MDTREIIDYNGTGRWSAKAIQERYATYTSTLNTAPQSDLTPRAQEHRHKRWIYPVMDQVIKGIEQGDEACIQIGVDFIDEDPRVPFGRILKSKTARTLRRVDLTPEQKERIRKRVSQMLVAGLVPREYQKYSRLMRTVGMGDW